MGSSRIVAGHAGGQDLGVENRPGPQPQRPRNQPRAGAIALPEWLKKPQFFLPALIVVGMLGLAFGLQPGGGTKAKSAEKAPSALAALTSPTAIATPTASPTRQPTVAPSPAATQGAGANPIASPGGVGSASTPSSEVAAARSTPGNTPAEPDLAHESTQCGAIQETATDLSVEQVLSGVSVRATRAAVYPVDYFRCILMATGGRDAVSLASAVSKAERTGATHAVLIDLWITNSSRDFGQVNLKTAAVAAAGQTFAPLATLGGRAEVVISGGQGRNVTLVVAVTNKIGEDTGPITVSLQAPLAGGKQTAGKYQLFQPTP